MKGRKTIPTKMKVLKGTARPSRLNQNEMENEKVEILEYPEGFEEDEKKIWDEVTSELSKLGILYSIHRFSIEMICTEYGIYKKACKNLRKSGMTVTVVTKSGEYETKSPWVSIRNESFANFKSMLVEFGLTLSSKGKITVPEKKPEKGDPKKLLKAI